MLDGNVGSEARTDGVPSVDVGADVTGGVIDPKAEEIGVGAFSDEACPPGSRPSARPIEKQRPGEVKLPSKSSDHVQDDG